MRVTSILSLLTNDTAYKLYVCCRGTSSGKTILYLDVEIHDVLFSKTQSNGDTGL